MIGKNIKMNWKLFLIIIVLIIIGCIFPRQINHYFIERKLNPSLENRTLLIVIENNFMILPEIEKGYENHKNLADTFFSYIFKVNKKELNNKSLVEIFDIYGEDYLANRFKRAAKNYGEIVVLNDKEASYDNFKRVLIDLNNNGKTIDILFDLHGRTGSIYFYNQEISKYSISYDKDLSLNSPLNIGYVYQTICYGEENMEIWLELGAQVVSGSKEINNFVILAPEKFLYLWTHGRTYYDAVNGGFDFEILVSKIIDKFFPNIMLSLTKDSLESSRMIFIGEKNYRLE
jgi:hypothetical protein